MKQALLIFTSAFLLCAFCACEETVVDRRYVAHRGYVRYSDRGPYDGGYYEGRRRSYYRQSYYDDEPAYYRVERRRYYSSPGVRVTTY